MPDAAPPWYSDIVTPALLGAARRGYSRSMREELQAAGFDDIPRVGMRVIGGIARNGPIGPGAARQLALRGDTAARLISTLTERGYLEAGPGAGQHTLTERGRAAAAVSARAVDDFEAKVRARVGTDRFAQARAVLGEMAELAEDEFADS